MAQRNNFATCLLIFNISPQTAIQRDAIRERKVGEDVIYYHQRLLKQTLIDAPTEGWQHIRVLDEQSLVEYRIMIEGHKTP